MSNYPCPVDGCDYEADNHDSLRGHVTGSSASDRAHKWARVKDIVASDDYPEAYREGGITPNEEGGSNDDAEDAAPDTPDEGADEGDSDTMPTEQEYANQGESEAVQGGSDDGEGTPEGDDDTPDEGGSGVPDIPTMYLVVGVLVVAVLAYLMLSDGGSGGDADAVAGDGAEDSGAEPETVDATGGVVG
jgi:hypothetical protein